MGPTRRFEHIYVNEMVIGPLSSSNGYEYCLAMRYMVYMDRYTWWPEAIIIENKIHINSSEVSLQQLDSKIRISSENNNWPRTFSSYCPVRQVWVHQTWQDTALIQEQTYICVEIGFMLIFYTKVKLYEWIIFYPTISEFLWYQTF